MAQSLPVDFGKTAKDYARYRAGFPESFFEKLFALAPLRGRKDVLDLGTGTGTVARGFARAGYAVTGLDKSESLMAEARGLDAAAGVAARYITGTAEETGLPGASFDIVTAGQCFHWFDPKRAPAEIARVLRPGGLFVAAYFDWVEAEDGPVGEMHRLRRKYNPAFKNVFPLGFYPQKPGDLSFEGFESAASFLYVEDVVYTQEAWRGRIRAYAGVGGSLPKEKVDEYDAEFAEALRARFPDPMHIPHKIWAEVWRGL